jgi:DNA repair protein RecO (recombination protein O)
MSYLKIRGVVVKEVNTNEADRIITIITAEHGKIQAMSKGARRSGSRLGTGTKLLCFSEFTLFKSKTMYYVNACEVLESFYGIREDMERLTYAAHVVEVINDAVQENLSGTRVMKLILNTLHFLTVKNRNPALITSIFELRLMAVTGYEPFVSGCMECGRLEPENMAFSFNMCGFLCSREECRKKDTHAIKLLPGTVKAIFHIVYSEKNELYNFTVSNEVMCEVEKICHRYLSERLEKNYTRLDFLKTLKL